MLSSWQIDLFWKNETKTNDNTSVINIYALSNKDKDHIVIEDSWSSHSFRLMALFY